MKVFITGAQGFIGSHLYKKLVDSGYEVKGIDNLSHPTKRTDIAFEYADVRYYNDIEPYIEWCDVVLHLAAQIHVDKSISNPEETIDTNVIGTLNILEACRKHKKRMVFASTSEVYGSSQKYFMDENHPLDAQSPYGASKVAGDRLCKAYYDTYGLDVRILRNFNTFGPHQNDGSYGSVISIFTRLALEGKPLKIFGTGNQERDYMYVDDAVAGYELCMTSDALKGRAINIGSGETITINDLAKKIIKYTGSTSEIVHVAPRPGEVERLCADTTKANSLGFRKKTTFDENLKHFIDWYKENIWQRKE